MAKAKAADKASMTSLFDSEDIRLRDPVWYTQASRQVISKVARGELKPLDATRINDWLDSLCRQHLGMTIQEATRQQASAFERVTKSLLECLPHDLDLIEREYRRTDELAPEVKKKCLNLLSRLRAVQKEARNDTAKAWIYVMRDSEGDVPPTQRDSEGNGVFHPQWFHVAFFMAWTQSRFPKVLVMAPPGHGKTTCLRWYLADKIGRNRHRRFLGLFDKADKPKREVPLVAKIISSPRYKAIFPNVRVLGRVDGAKFTDQQFTVNRPNWTSKEPTYEGFGIIQGFNGLGYDELVCDDMCPPSVREHPGKREQVWSNFTSVAQERLRNPKTAQIKMIATPWHDQDAHGRIRAMVAKGQLDGWLVLVDCFAIKDNADGTASPLWADRFTSDVLEQKKRIMGTRYTCNYRLQANLDSMKTLRRMWYYNADPNGEFTTANDLQLMEALHKGERWLSIDPSATAANWSSDQGVTEWVFSPGGYLFCTNVWFLHLGAVAMQDWLIRHLYRAQQEGTPYDGIYIEAQGGMRGQCSLWVQHIGEALKSGRIPGGSVEGEESEILTMAPYKGDPPRWSLTGTRMGVNSRNNLSKMNRLQECAHLIEHAWVRFAGERVKHIAGTANTFCRPTPHSQMERLQETLFSFDGTNNADAVDSVTQFLLGNRSKMRDPHARDDTPSEPTRPEDPAARLFQAAMQRTIKGLADGEEDRIDEELAFARKAWVA